jgi:starch synthase (maltosyl-transferring)
MSDTLGSMSRRSTPSQPVPSPQVATHSVKIPTHYARFTITDVSPVVQCGSFPAAGVVNEVIPFEVTAFREGHDALSVDIQFRDPHGTPIGPFPMHAGFDPDRFHALFQPDLPGEWEFTIQAWGDPWVTWLERSAIKIPAGLDCDLELTEGAQLLLTVSDSPSVTKDEVRTLTAAITVMKDKQLPASVRYAAATDHQVLSIMQRKPLQLGITSSGPWPLLVERERALVGAWYEFFPRSEGAQLQPPRSGTFAQAAKRLPAISAMGFDVIYLPPIHPIGIVNRKGRNNTLTPGPHDPGSPWAIGSADGGHDCIHPDLGTLDDFREFLNAASNVGLEVALDLALQAAPDHPWVTSHPEWFTHRADGSIAYAENPPKKYQDIYPLNFDNDPEGLFAEVERITRFWIDQGVKIFRVDNPHTKPVWVWNRLIRSINTTNPEVIFLAEAFTRAPMMRALAEQGFQQSYTYFTWKTGKDELEVYFSQLAGHMSAYMRPNVFTNTPDILHSFLQSGMPAAFAIRATLAATLSPTYGIYSGFELYEHVSLRPGSEEYLDSEKFELRPRDFDLAIKQGRSLIPYLTLLNGIRKNNVACSSLRTLRFHPTDSPHIIAYSKRVAQNVLLVVCSLDPFHEQSGMVHWNMPEIGLRWGTEFSVKDHITDSSWRWNDHTFVRLNPYENVAHIATVSSPTEHQMIFAREQTEGDL